MFLQQLTANFFLFITSLIGIAINRRSILIILMCIELVLLSLNLNFKIMSEHIFSMKSVISKSFEKVQLFYKNKLFQLYQIRINKILINKQDKTIIR